MRTFLTLTTATTAAALMVLGAVPAGHAATGRPAALPAAHSIDQERTPAPVINEVETNGDDVDWVELANPGDTALDLSGYVLTDSEPEKHAYTLPSDTVVPAGGLFTVTQEEEAAPGFDFGLGSEDSVQIFAPDAKVTEEPLAQFSWTSHAQVTWGRCPDVTGDFVDTFESSAGAPNVCEDPGAPTPAGSVWPGGQDVSVLDDADEERGDWSGIDVEPAERGADAPDGGHGRLWVVQNGDGELYRLSSADRGKSWDRDSTWKLRYPDGTGTVDAEGVTITTSSGQGVYVSSERNNDQSKVSRPSVLRYEIGEGTDSELRAVQEWNLAPDFPGLGANSGLEGITWIPDSWLTSREFVDQTKKAPYDPAAYPGHGAGLFAVAVEGTGDVYVYALQAGGEFHRVVTLDPGFDSIADVQFDADRDLLWAVCDDACDGQISTFALSGGEFTKTAVYDRPAKTPNYGNEGFAIAPLASCSAGEVSTYYVDDNNTDGHSLRGGSLSTDCPDASPTPTATATASGAPVPQPSGTSAPASAASAADEKATAPKAPPTTVTSTAEPSLTANDEHTPPGTAETERMATTGLPSSTWLIVIGAVVLLSAGLVVFLSARRDRPRD